MGTQLAYSQTGAIHITLANLASGSYAISSIINNSKHKYIAMYFDLNFRTTVVLQPPSRSVVSVFLLRSADGGHTFDDANINAQLLGAFLVDADNKAYTFSFDTSNRVPQLPDFFKLAVKNEIGYPFSDIGASLSFRGKNYTIVANGA